MSTLTAARPLAQVLQACGAHILQRGWLSSNSVLFPACQAPLIIDSGYSAHAAQTVQLVADALEGRSLARLFNTHLHSDHCGGNAALHQAHPDLHVAIPAGEASAVSAWDTQSLTFEATGQECPPFVAHGVLNTGDSFEVHGLTWEVHAAPGHDPNSLVFFQSQHRLLVSADALWENGFGVVFPELDGIAAFDAVGETLDVIEALQPEWIIPGHGAPFCDVNCALQRARLRLEKFKSDPNFHERYALKVLLKFKLLEWQAISWPNLVLWCRNTPYLKARLTKACKVGISEDEWVRGIVNDLCKSGAARLDNQMLLNQ